MAHNIRQKEKNKSQSNMIRSCLSSFMHKRRLFVLHACDLQSAPKTSNEGLEILYTKPNLFDLSLSQSAWWGKELDWLEISTAIVFSSKVMLIYSLSVSL